MHLLVPGISTEDLNTLSECIATSKFCPFKDCDKVEILLEDNALIFKYDSQHAFYRYPNMDKKDIVETMKAYLMDREAQMSHYSMFEIRAKSEEVESAVRNEFAKTHGLYFANKIDILQLSRDDKHYVMIKLPFAVVRQLMKHEVGTLMTVFRGTAGNLRKIPSLRPHIETDLDDSEEVHKIFTTKYEDGKVDDVRSLHYKVLQEVVGQPNLGICIGPIASWFLYEDS